MQISKNKDAPTLDRTNARLYRPLVYIIEGGRTSWPLRYGFKY